MWTFFIITGIIILFVNLFYRCRYKLVIKQGLPSDSKFYEGWKTEPLTTKWLKVSMSVIYSLFKQDPAFSYYAVINNIPVGVTGTSTFEEYYKHFNAGAQTVLSDKNAKKDDQNYVKLHLKAKESIDSYIKTYKLENVKKYVNSGLMVSESHRERGIGTALMHHKLKQLNSFVFTTTTNKFSANIMKKCGYDLIDTQKYFDFGIKSNDTFNVYVWVPEDQDQS